MLEVTYVPVPSDYLASCAIKGPKHGFLGPYVSWLHHAWVEVVRMRVGGKRVQRFSKVRAYKTQTQAQRNGLTGSLRNPKQKSNNEMLLSRIFNLCEGGGGKFQALCCDRLISKIIICI